MSSWRQIHDWKNWRAANLFAGQNKSQSCFAVSDSENKSWLASDLALWIVIVVVIGLVIMIAVPGPIGPTRSSPEWKGSECVNFLRQIDGAKNEWALENGKSNGTVCTESDIKPYLKLDANGNLPKCPSGGIYTIGKIGESPKCSLAKNGSPYHKLQ